MLTRNKNLITSILPVAVLYISSMLFGCATPRMIDELKAQVQEVESQGRQTQQMVSRIDSVIIESAEADKRLRNDMSITIDNLQQQIAVLLENYNDLMQRIERLGRQQTFQGSIKSSPGAQEEQPAGVQVEEQPSIDCNTTYDEAFILVRRGEYEKAIEKFQEFLQLCEKHELVENAYYWIGECYYSLEKYDQATERFEYLVKNYKSSVNTSRALYKLGRSKQELGIKDEAKKIFRQLIDDYPGTLEAEQAQERLKDIK